MYYCFILLRSAVLISYGVFKAFRIYVFGVMIDLMVLLVGN
jgi:hypothetical protein